MADEQNENTQEADFEATVSASGTNKDLWLFLIVVDVILLCVFGFFLYRNLSVRLLSAPPEVVAKTDQAALAQEEPAPEKPVSVTSQPVEPEPAVTPAAEPQPTPSAEPETQTPAAEQKSAAPAEPKESVVVTVNSKSKYRQVTFRYFEDAKSVAVVSGFTMAKPRALTKKNGVWEVTLSIAPGTYKYLFIVDGKQTLDPYAPEQNGRSVLVLK